MRVLEVRDETSQLDSFVEAYLVRAPAAGVVSELGVNPGANATTGQVLLQIADATALGVRLVVPVLEASFLESAAALVLQDDRGVTYPIQRIVLNADAHPAFVRVELYTNDAPAYRGVTVRYQAEEEVITVPWTVVASDGEAHWVVANNVILVLSRGQEAAEGPDARPLEEALVMAARDRLRPITLTVLSTVLGMSPLLLGGTEVFGLLQPLAIALVGTLLVSIPIAFLLLPGIAASIARRK